jgi:hypothetical protein
MFKDFLNNNWHRILKVIFLFSIVINVIAVMQYFNIQRSFLEWLMTHYGGETNADYGEMGSVAAITTFLAHRAVSIFAHPMAFAVHNLTLISLIAGILKSPSLNHKFKNRSGLILIMLFNIAGGIFSMSKTYFFSLIFMGGLYFLSAILSGRIKLKSVVITAILGVILIIAGAKTVGENRYIKGTLNLIASGDFDVIFASRFSESGYLQTSGAIDAAFETPNFIYGMGGNISNYLWSDSGYLQVLMVGGIFYFLVYYAFIFYLIYQLYKKNNKGNKLCSSLAILFGTLLLANSGVFVFIFPRIGMMLFIVTFFFLYINYYTPKVIKPGLNVE